ncbi:MAG: diguanylate cyclase [Spirochaetaceae bacterium]
MEPSCTFAELEQAASHYLDVYLGSRDLAATLRVIDPDMTGFGTARDEIGFSGDASYRLFQRDINELPASIEYDVLQKHVEMLGPDAGLVALELNLDLTILEQRVQMYGIRQSMVFRRAGARWLLVHQHVSMPTTVHGEHEPYPLKEIEERTRVLERLVAEKTRDLQRKNAELTHRSITDSLTGLNNRMKIEHVLRHELQRVRRHEVPLSIILMDIDHFKRVNDTLGHGIGDSVLAGIADVLQSRIRETDTVGRWGGEEFLIVCPLTAADECATLAEVLRERVENHPFGFDHTVTASFGVASYVSGDEPETLVHHADMALYAAKNAGRNRVRTAQR